MWYAVIDKKTGFLFSVGTVLADPMPDRFKVLELGDDFDKVKAQTEQHWDQATEAFIDNPPIDIRTKQDVIDEIVTELSTFTKTDQDLIQAKLEEKL